jgi:hypothetical protein
MSPYQQSPFPATLWPTLPGLWSPSRSFDPGIAPEADASRTPCASIPAKRNHRSFAAAIDPSFRTPAEASNRMMASLRSAPASSSLAVQPFGWGSLRRPWWRGVRRAVCGEAGGVTAMKQVSGPALLPFPREHRRVFPPSVPGSSDAGAFRRPLLGSCEDPPVTPCGAAARLPSGPASLRRLDNQMASSHLHVGLGDPGDYDDETVGLDPSRACVRASLFTMFDHGWPSLPMTRP